MPFGHANLPGRFITDSVLEHFDLTAVRAPTAAETRLAAEPFGSVDRELSAHGAENTG